MGDPSKSLSIKVTVEDIRVEPSNLHFSGPYSHAITEIFTLVNQTNRRIVFSVKDPATKLFQVGTTGGFIAPHESETVEVLLPPLFAPDGRLLAQVVPDFRRQSFKVEYVTLDSANTSGSATEIMHRTPRQSFREIIIPVLFDDELTARSLTQKHSYTESVDSVHNSGRVDIETYPPGLGNTLASGARRLNRQINCNAAAFVRKYYPPRFNTRPTIQGELMRFLRDSFLVRAIVVFVLSLLLINVFF